VLGSIYINGYNLHPKISRKTTKYRNSYKFTTLQVYFGGAMINMADKDMVIAVSFAVKYRKEKV
jgi:hypothetical protein